MYNGVIQLILPIIKPCDKRESTSVKIDGIKLKTVIKSMRALSIINDYLLENLLMSCVLKSVPIAAVKKVDPVRHP